MHCTARLCGILPSSSCTSSALCGTLSLSCPLFTHTHCLALPSSQLPLSPSHVLFCPSPLTATSRYRHPTHAHTTHSHTRTLTHPCQRVCVALCCVLPRQSLADDGARAGVHEGWQPDPRWLPPSPHTAWLPQKCRLVPQREVRPALRTVCVRVCTTVFWLWLF